MLLTRPPISKPLCQSKEEAPNAIFQWLCPPDTNSPHMALGRSQEETRELWMLQVPPGVCSAPGISVLHQE